MNSDTNKIRKKEFIDYITLSFIKHIDYMLENRDTEYLEKSSYTGLMTNKEELLSSKNNLLESVKPIKGESNINIDFIKRWCDIVEIDYETYNLVPFFRFFKKRVVDLYLNTPETRTIFIEGLLSFKYETHELTLTKTIENEGVMRELLREIASKFDENLTTLIVQQSRVIQSTFIQYFEGVLKNTSAELQVLNNSLEHKVEEKTRELTYNLYTDKLTGISNMNSFLKDAEQCDEKNIVLFNIDGFRKITSIYGYKISDQILRNIVEKINNQILTCGNYKLYRYHADWFIILETNKNKNNIEMVYNEVVKKFEETNIEVEKEQLAISFTAGIAKAIEEPIKYAELAFQKAKENKTSYEIYDDSMDILESYKKHQNILSTIKNAIKYDLVFPHFQLIRDNKNPEKKKYESLMRIKGPMGNMFSPFIFLDIAKDAKLYSSLSKIMMRKTIQTFEKEDATFSINLEVEDVLNSCTMNYLYELITRYKVEDKIILEITESEDIEDLKEVSKIFKQFKQIGVKVAIDDFGTGYSNFSYLTEFDFDYIKIDGSLIKNIHEDKNSFIVTQMIVDFAKRLNKQVIAEFIDKEEVQSIVEKLGINYSQGYLFSKPSEELI